MFRYFCILSLLSFPILLCSWSAPGHRVVSEIAYDHLTPSARQMVSLCVRKGMPKGMNNAAVWFDTVRSDAHPEWAKMHYINLPFSLDGAPTKPPLNVNAVTAIKDAMYALRAGILSPPDDCFHVKVLLHVVGDIHQPMHAVSAFSYHFRDGDLGGNRYGLAYNPVAMNLHAYWDAAGGSLTPRKKFQASAIRYRARRLEKQYPCDAYAMNLNVEAWANESFNIAREKAYSIRKNSTPSRNYQRLVKKISEERIALAGCRLAHVLNSLAG